MGQTAVDQDQPGPLEDTSNLHPQLQRAVQGGQMSLTGTCQSSRSLLGSYVVRSGVLTVLWAELQVTAQRLSGRRGCSARTAAPVCVGLWDMAP